MINLLVKTPNVEVQLLRVVGRHVGECFRCKPSVFQKSFCQACFWVAFLLRRIELGPRVFFPKGVSRNHFEAPNITTMSIIIFLTPFFSQ